MLIKVIYSVWKFPNFQIRPEWYNFKMCSAGWLLAAAKYLSPHSKYAVFLTESRIALALLVIIPSDTGLLTVGGTLSNWFSILKCSKTNWDELTETSSLHAACEEAENDTRFSLLGGSAFICGETLQVHLGPNTQQISVRCQVLLWLLGHSGGKHEDHWPRCPAHLEDQQVHKI